MAYMDAPSPIGHGATISAPHMHAYCLEALSPWLTPGAKVGAHKERPPSQLLFSKSHPWEILPCLRWNLQ